MIVVVMVTTRTTCSVVHDVTLPCGGNNGDGDHIGDGDDCGDDHHVGGDESGAGGDNGDLQCGA